MSGPSQGRGREEIDLGALCLLLGGRPRGVGGAGRRDDEARRRASAGRGEGDAAEGGRREQERLHLRWVLDGRSRGISVLLTGSLLDNRGSSNKLARRDSSVPVQKQC